MRPIILIDFQKERVGMGGKYGDQLSASLAVPLGDATCPERSAQIRTEGAASMTPQVLTGILAERVMKWTASPNRFMLGNGRWVPRWRFQPCENLANAFELLDAVRPKAYSMGADETGSIYAKVQIGGVVGECRNRSMPLAITFAVARASGIDVEDVG
jgi:hypothetical protein